MSKEYIGDSVYANIEDGSLVLTTESGGDVPDNTIYLEAAVWEALLDYVKRSTDN